ncbi:hypothetical protein [uncultured Xylophilus sp.]|uniref:hypothetical protein n=1 Tax=uncultured Xylophilus sp. TaxID=296832 RepID=UPI0025CB84AC|nr:hypothetical protein [uncultured Xylophilus sp.]
MKVQAVGGHAFTIDAECAADHALLDALHALRTLVVVDHRYGADLGGGVREVTGLRVVCKTGVSPLRATQAGCEVVRSGSQFLRLISRNATEHGHVATPAVDPQPQEKLASGFVELKRVLHALGVVVDEIEVMVEKVQCTHGKGSCVGTSQHSPSLQAEEHGDEADLATPAVGNLQGSAA